MTETPAPGATGSGAGELRADRFAGGQDLTEWKTAPGRALARAATRTSGRVGSRATLLLTLGIGIVTAVLLSFLVARLYDAVTEHDGIAALDGPVLKAATGIRSPDVDAIAAGVAYLFGPVGMPILALVAMAALAIHRRSWTPVILIGAAGIGSLLMTIAGKDIIDRHRPPHSLAIPPFETSPSFPSGHTLNAVVIAGVIAYLLILRERLTLARVTTAVVALVIAIAVGATRILLGAHWFTDVLAGWLLGAVWLALVITAHRLYLTTRHRSPAPVPVPSGAPGA